jgi:polar amino acid transport system substrate-binding protein
MRVYIFYFIASFLLGMSAHASEAAHAKAKPVTAQATPAAPSKPMETMRVVADVWCPYNCSKTNKDPGYLIEVLQEIFTPLSIVIEYELMPWSRSIEMVRAGQFHALVGTSRRDTADLIFPNQPQGISNNYFYVKAGKSWRYSGIPSLANIALGAIEDYAYSDDLDYYIAMHRNNPDRLQLVGGEDALELNIRKLIADRIDAVCEDSFVMDYQLKVTARTGKLETAGELMSQQPQEARNVYIAFSANSPDSKRYAELLSKGFTELRHNGRLAQILAKYGLKDWQ